MSNFKVTHKGKFVAECDTWREAVYLAETSDSNFDPTVAGGETVITKRVRVEYYEDMPVHMVQPPPLVTDDGSALEIMLDLDDVPYLRWTVARGLLFGVVADRARVAQWLRAALTFVELFK